MTNKLYKIGTRKSPLALRQAGEVLASLEKHYGKINAEIIAIDTYGDKDKRTPIREIEGTDFFTKELEDALLRGEIDFVVHSAKDMPDVLPGGLGIAVFTSPVDKHDVLISKDGVKLDDLPLGAKIGTSSKRRKDALKKYRADFEVVDIRGNIEERLRLLRAYGPRNDGAGLDAIVVAAAGLIRLGLQGQITQTIPFDILEPHPLQGALAIETREDDYRLIEFLSVIDCRRNDIGIGA